MTGIEMQKQTLKKNRIPHNHMKKNLTKMIVNIEQQNANKKPQFEIAGEFPAFVCAVYNQELNLRLGDYIVEVNKKNVSRASAKSVRKLIKSSNELQLTLCRPDEVSIHKLAASKPKPSLFSKYMKSKCLKLFQSSEHSNQAESIKSLMSCAMPIQPAKEHHVTLLEDHYHHIEIVKCNDQSDQQAHSHSTNVITTKLDLSTDNGYASLPESVQSTKTSYSSLDSLSTLSVPNKLASILSAPNLCSYTSSIKSDIQTFLHEIQNGIEIFVRPSMVLNIMSKQECLDLYQNVEKLIPVTKFMLSIINSFDSSSNSFLNVESLQIVFSSFKTYLSGLPNAVDFLGYLTSQNNEFILFLEKINDLNTLKIFDFIFMPFNFVCKLIDYMKYIVTQQTKQSSSQNQKLTSLVKDLYEFSIETQLKLENHFQSEQSHETLRVQIKDSRFQKTWTEASLSMCRKQLIIDIIEGSQLIIDFNLINNVFNSRNPLVIHLDVNCLQLPGYSLSIKFESEQIKNSYSTLIN